MAAPPIPTTTPIIVFRVCVLIPPDLVPFAFASAWFDEVAAAMAAEKPEESVEEEVTL